MFQEQNKALVMIKNDSQCKSCKHFYEDRVDGCFCAAFPDGIPKNILNNKKIHNSPVSGQVGLFVYEEKSGGQVSKAA